MDIKKILVGAGIGAVALGTMLGFAGEPDFTPTEVVNIERNAQEIFGGNAEAVERMIFDTMRPAQVKVKGRDWELEGSKFKTLLKENAEDGWTFEEGGKQLKFKSAGIAWDGEAVNTKAEKVKGEIKELEVKYNDALGSGVNIKIVQDNYKFQKIIEIESLASLGTIPEGAEYLEFSFEVTGDFDLPDGRMNERISLSEDSTLLPVRAWDSSETPENPEDEILSCAFGEILNNVITKKIPVEWLLNAEYPVMTDTTITYGSEYVFNSGSATYYPQVAKLDTDKFVIVYQDWGNSGYGTAVIGTVSGTTITYGSEYVFNSAASGDFRICILSASSFVVAYNPNTGTVGVLYRNSKVGSVSGTTITFGSSAILVNGEESNNYDVSTLDSTHIIAVHENDYWRDPSGIAKIGTISGTTITYGSEYNFIAVLTNYTVVKALSSSTFIVTYQTPNNSYYGESVACSISGSVISCGSAVVFNSGTTNQASINSPSSSSFIIGYKDTSNSSYGTAIVGSVSGTTITYGSEYVFNSGATSHITISEVDTSKFTISYVDDGNSSYGTAIIGTVSGTTISYGSEYVFNSGSTSYTRVATIDTDKFVIVYQDWGNSGYGTGIIGTLPADTPAADDTNFFGVNF